MGKRIERLFAVWVIPFSWGKRGLTEAPINRSGPSCRGCPSMGGNGEEGVQSELELEPGDSELSGGKT